MWCGGTDSRAVIWEEMTISFGNQSPFSSLDDSPAVVLASRTVSGKNAGGGDNSSPVPSLEAFRVMNTLPWQGKWSRERVKNPPIEDWMGKSDVKDSYPSPRINRRWWGILPRGEIPPFLGAGRSGCLVARIWVFSLFLFKKFFGEPTCLWVLTQVKNTQPESCAKTPLVFCYHKQVET